MPDHVHMLAGIPPKLAVASFMGYLKGESAPMMRALHANLEHEFGSRHFWPEGCCVSAVGPSEAAIRKRIQGAGSSWHRAGQAQRQGARGPVREVR